MLLNTQQCTTLENDQALNVCSTTVEKPGGTSHEEMQAAQGTRVLFWVPQRTREGE